MNPDNPFIGKSIAVTGKLENYTRAAIKARLLELGAKPVSKVSSWSRLWPWESLSCLSRHLSI